MKIYKSNFLVAFFLLTLFPFSSAPSQQIKYKDLRGLWSMYFGKDYIGRFIFADTLKVKIETMDQRLYFGKYELGIDHNHQYLAFSWKGDSDSIQVAY